MAEQKINGRTFRVGQLTAGDAIELYAEVIGFLGPAAGQLPYILFGMKEGGDDGDILKDAAVIAAFGQVVQVKGAKAIRELTARLVSMADIQRPSGDYTSVDLDGDLSDDPSEVMAIVVFVLKEHFRPFFSGSGGGGLFGRMATAFRQLK